ncbi:hypothetical protein RB25_11455 [Herbaspirillum rubrisubalbicans]|uniref:Uncharacterized protein n=2 Tax=Herbaspirillum rubrisubalbicans TaxID=80842 RepID=A0ABX9BZW9_9BURK|nr:hypothetical protein [Herbaspirillum rubrisubalbicans]MCP1573170.1 hypothetical protein [Herbaspirillum rubrisubalbicans]NQE47498.1 hypothetical protein [Herbaspirillum rubrisubalbicans]QJQ01704.1 hypothetical protein C798_16100 [Herbaspirillum rubrisubalbicans Os34]RAM63366.1 hypothetical protein RB24_16340 [Herbaspirillum rubrisubalbicans]RAN48402.1 hypothetical protein RB25_11455 [Herbaspirillum rubrisubalbicans]
MAELAAAPLPSKMSTTLGAIACKYLDATIKLTPVLRTDGKWTAFVHIDFPDRTTHEFGDFKPGNSKMEALQNAVTAAEHYIVERKKK